VHPGPTHHTRSAPLIRPHSSSLTLGQQCTCTLRSQDSRYTPRRPSCCGRRASVWSGACSNRPSGGFGEAARRASSLGPGGGEHGGVPVHPPRLRTHRTSPAQALLTILSTHALPPSCVWCPVCTSGAMRAERGWVVAVDGAQQRSRVSAAPPGKRVSARVGWWAGGYAKRRAVPRQLLAAARGTALRMAGASAASTRGAPSHLYMAARSTALRTEEAGGANWKAAPRRSLKLLAASSAQHAPRLLSWLLPPHSSPVPCFARTPHPSMREVRPRAC
jgi:hypothetical protein